MNLNLIQNIIILLSAVAATHGFAANSQNRVKPVNPVADKSKVSKTPKTAAQAPKKSADGEPNEDIPTLNIENTWESAPKNFGTPKETAKAVLSVRVEDIVEPPSEYHYASFGYADPFIPPLRAEPSETEISIHKSETPLISPLQKYSLNELTIAGVWLTSDQVWKTLIMTPKGEGIIAKLNDPIANREGKILGINDDGIKVREFRINPDGTREIIDSKVPLSSANSGSNVLSTTTPALSKGDSLEEANAEMSDMVKRLDTEVTKEKVKGLPLPAGYGTEAKPEMRNTKTENPPVIQEGHTP